MPRIVQHTQRRSEIIAALWRVIVRDGIDAVSVRSVAQEGGWSPGSLRYYFTTQSALMRFAMLAVLERATARIRERLVMEEGTPDRVEAMARVLEEGLPLDDERRVEILIWSAFYDSARIDPTLQGTLHAEWRAVQFLCRIVVRQLGLTDEPVEEEIPFTDAAETESLLLHAFYDGLPVQPVRSGGVVDAAMIRLILRGYLRQMQARAPR